MAAAALGGLSLATLGWWATGTTGIVPTLGGTVVLTRPAGADSFDPYRAAAGGREIARLVADPVLEAGPDGQRLPGAASAWAWSDDHLQLELTLRDGLRFHDHPCFPSRRGRFATSADLAWSIERAVVTGEFRSPVVGLDAYLEGGARLVGVTVASARQVVLELTGPAPFLEHELTHTWLLPRDLARCDPDVVSSWPAGTGPFRMTHADPLGRLEAERNPTWWGLDDDGGRLPRVDHISWSETGDAIEAFRRIELGALHLHPLLDPDQWPSVLATSPPGSLRFRPEFRGGGVALGHVEAAEGLQLLGLTVLAGTDNPALDPLVRARLGVALDREALAAGLAGATARPRLLTRDLAGWAEGGAQPADDDAEPARTLRLVHAPHRASLARAIAAQLTAAGVPTEPESLRGAPGAVLQTAGADLLLAPWRLGTTAGEPVGLLRLAEGLDPALPWSDDAASALARDVARRPGRPERAAGYGELEQLLLSRGPLIPLLEVGGVVPHLYSERLHQLFDPRSGRSLPHPRSWLVTAWLDPAE